MNDILFSKKIKEREAEQLRSSSAQRLIEKLSLLRNRRDASRRRWFWELLQNASDYNDNVNVELIVDDEKVVFKHDGLPFIDTDVFNLIRPDSNKKDDNRRKDNIGKFGSGFVSTHILSSRVKVNGIVQDDENNMYEFEVDLNRSNYLTKSLLIDDINKSIDQFANSIKPITNLTGFTTSFTYYTSEPLPNICIKDIGLNYIYRILPYTLCFMPKILSVQIVDNRNRGYKSIIKRSSKNVEGSIIFNVSIKNSPIEEYEMKVFNNDDVSSCFHIKDNKVMPLPIDIAKLFCGLPLVGTEKTGLPIIVNSLNFEPTTERDGVEIDPECDKQNIRILTSSIDLFDEILDYVEENEILNAYEIVGLNDKYDGMNESQIYFKDFFVGKLKNIVLKHKIVQNINDVFVKVDEICIPTNEKLYGFAKELDSDILPKDYSGWQSNLQFFTEQKYSYEDLAYSIQESNTGFSNKETLNWLKKCLSYLIGCDKKICSDYNILPNQNRGLNNKNALFCDKNLPAQLKRINEQTEGCEKLASKLLNKNFNLIIDLSEFTTKQLANRIDDNIKEIYSDNDSRIPAEYESCVNSLYSWTKDCNLDEEKLLSYFPWFYPKRASLIADMMTEEERNQSLKIVRSGKMEYLSLLAESDLSGEDIKFLADNIEKVRSTICHKTDVVDDKTYADSEEGDHGEQIVWKDLQKKYPLNKGYKVIWASRDLGEPRYDFRIEKDNKTICYYDAKTTSRGLDNADSIPFFLRKSQWLFLNEIGENIPYYIARVFIADGNLVRYIRICAK